MNADATAGAPQGWLKLWEDHPLRWSVLLVVAFALAASVSGLGNGFAYDDIAILVENPMVNQLHTAWEYLTSSYWGPARGNSLYRPVTVIAYALEWALGGGAPWPFHLMNVILYAITALAVLGLARQLLPAGAALIGSLFWAAHPVHVEAVANVVGQSEMLTAIPMLLAVSAYIRDRKRGPVRNGTVLLIGALFALALSTKEHGIVLPALLVLAEIALRRSVFKTSAERSGDRWRLARVLVLITVAYLTIRFSVLQGFAGDSPHPALEQLSVGERAWVMLGLAPEFARLFFWPFRLYADYSPPAVPVLASPDPRHLLGLAWLVVFGALATWGWRRDRVTAFALLWLMLTLGPVSNILIATGVLVAERTLFFPTVALSLLVGRGVVLGWPLVRQYPARWVRAAIPATLGVVLLAATAHSADRQLVWEDNATLFAITVTDAPDNFRAQHALGELFGKAGQWRRAETHLRLADSLFPGYDLLELSLARVLHFDDRCPEALPLYSEVLRKRGVAEVAAIGRAACLLEARRLSEARSESVEGIARGLSVGSFGLLLQKAESSLVATDTVDARNRWWRAGAPFSRSSERLKVPVLIVRPNLGGRPRRTPQSSLVSPPDSGGYLKVRL